MLRRFVAVKILLSALLFVVSLQTASAVCPVSDQSLLGEWSFDLYDKITGDVPVSIDISRLSWCLGNPDYNYALKASWYSPGLPPSTYSETVWAQYSVFWGIPILSAADIGKDVKKTFVMYPIGEANRRYVTISYYKVATGEFLGTSSAYYIKQ